MKPWDLKKAGMTPIEMYYRRQEQQKESRIRCGHIFKEKVRRARQSIRNAERRLVAAKYKHELACKALEEFERKGAESK